MHPEGLLQECGERRARASSRLPGGSLGGGVPAKDHHMSQAVTQNDPPCSEAPWLRSSDINHQKATSFPVSKPRLCRGCPPNRQGSRAKSGTCVRKDSKALSGPQRRESVTSRWYLPWFSSDACIHLLPLTWIPALQIRKLRHGTGINLLNIRMLIWAL